MGIVLIARCYTQGSGNGFSSRNLWLWLINHRVPRNEIDRQPIKVYLDLFKQSYSKSGEQRPHWNQRAREFCVHRLSITQWKQRLVLRRKDTAVTLHRPTHSTFCLVFPNGASNHLTCILVYCGKGKYLNLGDIRYWLKFLGTCNSTVVSWIEGSLWSPGDKWYSDLNLFHGWSSGTPLTILGWFSQILSEFWEWIF